MRPWQRSQPFSSSSPPFDGESGDDQFPLPSEVSMLDNVSMASNMMGSAIDDSPPFRPSASPAPLDTSISTNMYNNNNDDYDDEDNQKTPMPDKMHPSPDVNDNHHIEQHESQPLKQQQHLQIPRPSASAGTNNMFADHSSLFEHESRLDAFELLSIADGVDAARSSSAMKNKDQHDSHRHINGNDNKRESQKERSTTLTLKEQEKVGV